MTQEEEKYLEYYSFKKINDFSRIAVEESISEEKARDKYKSISHYIAIKIGFESKEAEEKGKEYEERLKPEISKIQAIFGKSINRQKHFEDFQDFYNWFDKQKKECFYCKTKESELEDMFNNRKVIESKKFTSTLHIERIDSKKEYKKENMVLACALCNNAKSDMISQKDYEKYFAEPMEKYLSKCYKTTDSETNFLYIADPKCLNKNDYKNKKEIEIFYDNFKQILKDNNIKFDIIPNTKDIWCRDYMPIQLNPKKFLSFKYEPDYLNKQAHLKTNFSTINLNLNGEVVDIDIILDGGNIIRHKDKVILTDKIFQENPRYKRDELISKLEKIFQANIIIIPWDKKDDYCGHADGMIRFINENKVLINGSFKKYNKDFKDKFFNALTKNNLEYEELNFDIENENEKLNWGYINYLQMKDIIILPEFGIKEDSIAKERFSEIFEGYKIITINAKSIIENDGVLNCITWNIYNDEFVYKIK